MIAVADPDEAVWEMRSSPGIDLLITDVRLRPELDDDDTSGLRLGDYVKSIRPELPVAVYSTTFLEGELDEMLSDSARSRFDVVLPRGGELWHEENLLDECVQLAKGFRDRRYTSTADGELATSATGIKVMREFVVGRAPKKSSDKVLKESGYTLRLLDVRHGELRGPIAIWVLEHGDRVSAELYQRPDVHAVGSTLNEALDRLGTNLHASLDVIAPDGDLPKPDSESIPWLMLQHCDSWDQLASKIRSRD